MKLLSINELHILTGCTRETVGKKLEAVTFEPGPKGAKLYNSETALRMVLGVAEVSEEGEVMTQAEANRRLTIKRGQQIDLEMEVLKGERPKLEEVMEVWQGIWDDIAGIIKGSELSEDRKKDIMDRLAKGPEEVKAL